MEPETGTLNYIVYAVLAVLSAKSGRDLFQERKTRINGNGKDGSDSLLRETKRSVDKLWERFEKTEEKLSDKMENVNVEIAKIGTMVENIQTNQKYYQDKYSDVVSRVHTLESKNA